MSENELLLNGFINIGNNDRGLKFYVKLNLPDDGLVLHKVKDGYSLGTEFFEVSSIVLLSNFLNSVNK